MMKLSTLWEINQTLDGAGHSSIADAILGAWAHDGEPASFWRASANFVFTCRINDQRCFLRFADDYERQRAGIEAEVAIVRWLSEHGMAVAVPIASRSGSDVETVTTPLGTFHAVVFAGLEGEQPAIDELDEAHMERWGAALGAFHSLIKDYRGDNVPARPTWRDQLEHVRPFLADDVPGLHREWDTVYHKLDALPVERDTFGLIHFDFELDNLVWHDATVAALDWDDCIRSWFAADIAYALRDLFDPGVDLSDPRLGTFVHGYTSRCDLDQKMLDQLPLFMRMHNLIMYARLVRSCDLEPDGDYPDWLRGLDVRFKERTARYRASTNDQ